MDSSAATLVWEKRRTCAALLVPSPVFGDGLVFSTSGFEKPTIRAIRPDGIGDVTQSHIAWEQTAHVPAMSS
ncbi:MAG: hypothetical protein NTU53_15785, partial [Planctomycetota bacterium]|nr:hypothetical protein [Planctomycetota bacterium]